MKCPNCGSELPENSLFCTACGASTANQQLTNNSQPDMYGQQPQPNMYGQQPNMYNQKPPKKPLTKKQKITILSVVAGIAILAVFFAVILPLLTKSKLQGSYTSENEIFVFDNGTFTLTKLDYDPDVYYYVGTYTLDGDTINMKAVNNYTDTATFNPSKNTITYDKNTAESDDKKATIPVKLSENTLDKVKSEIKTYAETALGDKDIFDEAVSYGEYFIYSDDLKDPYTDFEIKIKELVKYDTEPSLYKFLLEDYNIAIEIDIASNGDVTVDAY